MLVVADVVRLICWRTSVSKLLKSPWNSCFDWSRVVPLPSKMLASVAFCMTMLDSATSFDTVRRTFFFQEANCALSFAMLFVSFRMVNCFAALIDVARSDTA